MSIKLKEVSGVNKDQRRNYSSDDDYTSNFDDDRSSGYDDNYDSSYDDSYDGGYDDSYDGGYDDNYDSSYDDGYDDNYDRSYDDSYDDSCGEGCINDAPSAGKQKKSRGKKSRKKKKSNPALTALLSVLCVIFIGIFAFSGYKLYTIIHNYKVAERKNDGLIDRYVTTAPKKEKPKAEKEEEDLRDPEVSPIDVDFDALLEQNEDVVGWIYCPDTVINYPMVKAEDNMFYLHRMVDKSYNPNGSLFLDCLNEPDFTSDNTIIYGHNMNDGSMFASIHNYKNQEYFDKHPVLYINTPDGNYRVELFAGYVTDADSDTYTMNFYNKEKHEQYFEKMVSQSTFKSPYVPEPKHKIVTLSTCSYEFYDARYVIQGILIPIH